MGRHLSNPWWAVAAWIAFIYAAIPFVRSLREAFAARWPVETLGFAVMGAVAAAAAGALLACRRRRRRVRISDIGWLGGIAAGLIVWTHLLMGQPEEAVHFIEYGVLGVLLYRALRPDIDDPGVFIAAALIGTIVGTVDEIIQWVVPDRYWDVRDLVLNGGASVLVQIAIWRLAPAPSSRLTPHTIRVLCRLAACWVVLLTLCLAATPQRLAALARTFPALQPLTVSEDAMTEYGFLHRLDENTQFRSRLSRTRLAEQDRARSVAAAAKLDGFRGRYGRFLRDVPPADDPFVYEMGVHIFARDHSLAEAQRHAVGTREHLRSMTAAAREQRILERVFGGSLSQSTHAWSDRQRRAVSTAGDPGARFVSNVAGHVVTAVSETRLRTLLVTVIALLVAADLMLSRSLRRQAGR
jgi:hypothetical protein